LKNTATGVTYLDSTSLDVAWRGCKGVIEGKEGEMACASYKAVYHTLPAAISPQLEVSKQVKPPVNKAETPAQASMHGIAL
jgi:hypothetical protein